MNKRIIIQDLISDTGQVGKVTVIGDDTPGPNPSVLVPKTITENGTYDPADDEADGYSSVEVEVQGREKTLTKLADVTIMEPVRVVEITVTEAIRSCQMFYFVNSGVVLSENDWMAYIINDVVFYCRQQTTAQPDCARPFCILPPCTINGVSHDAEPMDSSENGYFGAIFTQSSARVYNDGITSLKIVSYNGNADLTAGHFEIWGWV